jgi:hypothetical protein
MRCGRQLQPTAGLLYLTTKWRGVDVSLKTFELAAKMSRTIIWALLAIDLLLTSAAVAASGNPVLHDRVAEALLVVNEPADHLINAAEAAEVTFTVSGLGSGEAGVVTITDAVNHQVVINVDTNGTYSANLSTLVDGTISSSLSTTVPGGQSVEGDYSGTVTFTDSTGRQDVVNIGSNGTYSANPLNLTNGTLTYLMQVSDPAGNVISVDPTTTLGPSGSASALAGTPQLPTLLSGYAVRPAWAVAGVDYPVGINSGVTLKDPATGSLPSGVTRVSTAHLFQINGNNVTIDSWDFSLEGGWAVEVDNGNGTIIQNCNFKVGSNGNGAIYVAPGASNVTIQYNDIDGQGLSGEEGYIHQVQIGVGLDGSGTTIFQYNYIHDWWGQDVVMGSFAGGENWIIHYNVIANAGEGFSQGAHGDWIQSYNDQSNQILITNSRHIQFNTFLQNNKTANTQGISESGQWGGNAIRTDVITNNTFVMLPGTTVTYPIIEDTSHLAGSATIANNFMDTSGVQYGWNFIGDPAGGRAPYTGPYNGAVSISNNVNMLTGAYYTNKRGVN